MSTVDQDAKRELELYIENDSRLHNQFKSIVENVKRKIKAGKYSPALAPKLWGYWVEAGAKLYAKEFARAADWSKLFPKPTRDALAKEFAAHYHAAILRGEY